MKYVGDAGKRRWRDHKIFIIQQKCNNTADIFVPEYIVVGDALTIGCAAEMKFINIVSTPLSSQPLFLKVWVHGKFDHRVSREGLGTLEV